MRGFASWKPCPLTLLTTSRSGSCSQQDSTISSSGTQGPRLVTRCPRSSSTSWMKTRFQVCESDGSPVTTTSSGPDRMGVANSAGFIVRSVHIIG